MWKRLAGLGSDLPSSGLRSSSIRISSLARASSAPTPNGSVQYVPGSSPRSVIWPASPPCQWPCSASMRQASAIFWARVHCGSLTRDSISRSTRARNTSLSCTV
ncbi:Uncharacterised protein [Bordetella pertussis]|nr:Uncharacterised protein [Bordetella pertussis]